MAPFSSPTTRHKMVFFVCVFVCTCTYSEKMPVRKIRKYSQVVLMAPDSTVLYVPVYHILHFMLP